MISHVKTCLQKYIIFSGRATRSEYWYFNLFIFIIAFIGSYIDISLGIGSFGIGPLWIIVSLGTLIPAINVTTRRLHDIGKSGWMQLIGLIPIIGWVWLFILLIKDSQPGKNKYGKNPKKTEK